MRCLPPELHNRPERIPPAVRALIRALARHYRTIFVAYADCGTGGRLDAVLAEEGVERLPGAHCYEFFATRPVFAELAEAEPGTFYLTDFLLRHFERLVVERPRARPPSGARTRVLPQLPQAGLSGAGRAKPDSADQATAIAKRMGLGFEYRATGYGTLATR